MLYTHVVHRRTEYTRGRSDTSTGEGRFWAFLISKYPASHRGLFVDESSVDTSCEYYADPSSKSPSQYISSPYHNGSRKQQYKYQYQCNLHQRSLSNYRISIHPHHHHIAPRHRAGQRRLSHITIKPPPCPTRLVPHYLKTLPCAMGNLPPPKPPPSPSPGSQPILVDSSTYNSPFTSEPSNTQNLPLSAQNKSKQQDQQRKDHRKSSKRCWKIISSVSSRLPHCPLPSVHRPPPLHPVSTLLTTTTTTDPLRMNPHPPSTPHPPPSPSTLQTITTLTRPKARRHHNRPNSIIRTGRNEQRG